MTRRVLWGNAILWTWIGMALLWHYAPPIFWTVIVTALTVGGSLLIEARRRIVAQHEYVADVEDRMAKRNVNAEVEDVDDV